MTGLAALLLLPSTALPMILVLLVLGLPVGPLMVTVFAIGGVVAPDGKLGTVMTALASGIVAGTAHRLVHRGAAGAERRLFGRVPGSGLRRGGAVPARRGSRRRPPAPQPGGRLTPAA